MEKFLLADEILFDAKPDAVPYSYRISYKISQLCLIISMSCGRGGCSLVKLHMISNALCTQHNMHKLSEFANDRLSNYTLVRFEPSVNRAIKYALADGLLYQQQNGLFRLADKGKELMKKIKNEEDLLVNEKAYLSNLSDKLTEDKIKNLMSTWRYSNAEDK